MFITYPLLTLSKYPYRSWNSNLSSPTDTKFYKREENLDRSVIDQHFTHVMDLRKYKEKFFFCGHILTNCLGDGNWRWFRSRKWQKNKYNILLTSAIGLSRLFSLGVCPNHVSVTLPVFKKGQWTELLEYWYSPTLPFVKFLYHTAKIMSIYKFTRLLPL